jgi:hypothetical protein
MFEQEQQPIHVFSSGYLEYYIPKMEKQCHNGLFDRLELEKKLLKHLFLKR